SSSDTAHLRQQAIAGAVYGSGRGRRLIALAGPLGPAFEDVNALFRQAAEAPARLVEAVSPSRPAGAPCRLHLPRIDEGEKPFAGPALPCEAHRIEEQPTREFAALAPEDGAVHALLVVEAMLLLPPRNHGTGIGGDEQ